MKSPSLIADLNALMRERGVTWRQLTILVWLRKTGRPMEASELDELTLVSNGCTAMASGSMEGRGLVRTWYDYSKKEVPGMTGPHRQSVCRIMIELRDLGRKIADACEDTVQEFHK